ncbi:ABC transporter permease [Ruania albidiflava]|uniref:ABC transporter permease n=1 Tax=Ruania albidiflava TaxID=366586 RepID=UPI0003B6D532|nr:ABC transporter permease subunit [Ruania albidiflava]
MSAETTLADSEQRVAATKQPPGRNRKKARGRNRLWAHIYRYRVLYLLMAPALAYVLVYKYGPLYGLLVAFKDYNLGLGILDSPWADPWYSHFAAFVTSPYAGQLIRNTLVISVYKLVFGTVAAIGVALLFNECRVRWFRRWVQTLSYMPHFLSWVVVYGVAVALLSQSTGYLNTFFRQTFGDTVPFLTSTEWFRTVLVTSDIWKDIGWGAIIYLAAMVGINPELYEAARMDGAGRVRQIWHITLPGIRNVIILLLVLKLGGILDAGFDQVFIFLNPLVLSVGDIIDTWVYRVGLVDLNYSVAAAAGLFKSIIGLVLMVTVNRMARRWDGQVW